MRDSTPSADVVVVGAGIIGLSAARRARAAGASVTVLERDAIGHGASHVAAGMLAPVAEAEFGAAGRRLLALGLRSAEMWPAFADELRHASGEQTGVLETGTLVVARDDDEARELERQLAFRRSLGLRAQRLLASAARELEPALAPGLRLAIEAPDDHSVDPRAVVRALALACRRDGVELLEHCAARTLRLDAADDRVTGVVLDDAREIDAGQVLVASGAWAGGVDGLPADAQVPVRPVKGQILRLRDPAGPGLAARVVRFRRGYLVPRGDGRYVLGATVEEKGFELSPTAGGVYELLRDCRELLPGVSELEIEELCVGLRPGTPDNVPIVGRGALDGLVWATGHHRNGILLAPLTAELAAAALAGEQPDRLAAACAPERFVQVAA